MNKRQKKKREKFYDELESFGNAVSTLRELRKLNRDYKEFCNYEKKMIEKYGTYENYVRLNSWIEI